MAFLIVLKNVSVMMVYLLVGLFMVKSKKAESAHAKSISTLLIYVCGPCMIVNSFLGMDSTRENSISVFKFFVTTLIIQVLFFLICYMFIKDKLKDPKYRILSIGGVLGNVGFLGLPLVTALFPDKPVVAGYSSIYVMSMNIIVFSIGVFMITGDRKYISIKPILFNPTTIAIALSLPLYIFDVKLPQTVVGAVELFGKMTVPICMIVLGMRLASVSVKDLFSRPFAYISCGLKLIVYPIFAYLCVKFLPFFDDVFKVSVLVLSTVPTGAIVLSLAEIHEQQQELAANVVLLTTIFSIITIPLIMLMV